MTRASIDRGRIYSEAKAACHSSLIFYTIIIGRRKINVQPMNWQSGYSKSALQQITMGVQHTDTVEKLIAQTQNRLSIAPAVAGGYSVN